ncbi:unnamed protein product [Paramecium primaurelia]|uniref:Uncharacterized protein n=1 Tax=Paramecium primaurelia TaxID=5886 RepID=A0A8S1MI99_PARPR|nr:unnamed protein product [Paramecium primaurelia]
MIINKDQIHYNQKFLIKQLNLIIQNSPNPIQIPKQMLIEVHKKIKRLNLIFVENSDLEFQINYMLPKYTILRMQNKREKQILKCQNKYQKRNSLEQRFKMKQFIEQIKNKTKNDPSEFLTHTMSRFDSCLGNKKKITGQAIEDVYPVFFEI